MIHGVIHNPPPTYRLPPRLAELRIGKPATVPMVMGRRRWRWTWPRVQLAIGVALLAVGLGGPLILGGPM